MRDFNFFEDLAVNRKKETSSSTYLIGAALLLILTLGSVTYYYILQFRALQEDKVLLESQINDPNHQQQYNTSLALQEEVAKLEKEKLEIESVHGKVLDSRMINSLLLKEISLAKPDAVAIKSIYLTPQGISVEGASINYDLIARFEHNLRGNPRFVGPFVPNILKEDEDHYSFSLNFSFSQPVNTLEEEDIVNGEG